MQLMSNDVTVIIRGDLKDKIKEMAARAGMPMYKWLDERLPGWLQQEQQKQTGNFNDKLAG